MEVCHKFINVFTVKRLDNNNNNNNNNNNDNNGLISVHPWYGSSPDIRVKLGN